MKDLYFFDNEDIIGYSPSIIGYLNNEIKELTEHYEHDEVEMELQLSYELIEELVKHDGYVMCCYHPSGAYTVYDLYYKKGNEYEQLQ